MKPSKREPKSHRRNAHSSTVVEDSTPRTPDVEELYRVKEMKGLLKVSRTTLYRWVRDGKIAAPLQLSPNVIAWRRSAVVEFLKRQESA